MNELKNNLTPAQILYSSTDKLENIKNELVFKNKQKANGDIINYDYIENDKTLSKQEKIEKLKERKQQVDKEITRQGNIEKGKIIGLGALEIGAMALPQGSVMKAGAKVGEAVLRKHVGKAIGKAVGEGVASGVVTGSVGGAIDAAKNKENVLKGAAGGAVAGGAVGAVGGGAGANIEKVVKGRVIDTGSANKKIQRKLEKEYYQDYEQGVSVKRKDIGEIKLSSCAIKETQKQKPEYAKKVVNLSKKLKKAKYNGPEEPKHPHTKYEITKFHRLQDKDADYEISENKKGDKYFYKITEPTLKETESRGKSLLERAKDVLYNKFRT